MLNFMIWSAIYIYSWLASDIRVFLIHKMCAYASWEGEFNCVIFLLLNYDFFYHVANCFKMHD